MTHRRWPEILTARREVIETHTAEGEACTLLAVRDPDGRLGLYYHGGIRASAMLPPPVYEQLVAALSRLTSTGGG